MFATLDVVVLVSLHEMCQLNHHFSFSFRVCNASALGQPPLGFENGHEKVLEFLSATRAGCSCRTTPQNSIPTQPRAADCSHVGSSLITPTADRFLSHSFCFVPLHQKGGMAQQRTRPPQQCCTVRHCPCRKEGEEKCGGEEADSHRPLVEGHTHTCSLTQSRTSHSTYIHTLEEWAQQGTVVLVYPRRVTWARRVGWAR